MIRFTLCVSLELRAGQMSTAMVVVYTFKMQAKLANSQENKGYKSLWIFPKIGTTLKLVHYCMRVNHVHEKGLSQSPKKGRSLVVNMVLAP